jgi:hypothetical protein
MWYGDDTPAPCPALRQAAGRYWCGIVAAEAVKTPAGEPLAIADALGIGKGCCTQDDDLTTTRGKADDK